jgi:hypothetical protein
LSQPLPHPRFNLFVTRETFTTKVYFLADQPDGSHEGPSPGCEADVQEFPTVFLVFSPGLLALYAVRHYHDETLPLLPVGLDVFCELHPEASTELHSTLQNSLCHHASENELTVLAENPKTW